MMLNGVIAVWVDILECKTHHIEIDTLRQSNWINDIDVPPGSETSQILSSSIAKPILDNLMESPIQNNTFYTVASDAAGKRQSLFPETFKLLQKEEEGYNYITTRQNHVYLWRDCDAIV